MINNPLTLDEMSPRMRFHLAIGLLQDAEMYLHRGQFYSETEDGRKKERIVAMEAFAIFDKARYAVMTEFCKASKAEEDSRTSEDDPPSAAKEPRP